jgi:hypothetical protein
LGTLSAVAGTSAAAASVGATIPAVLKAAKEDCEEEASGAEDNDAATDQKDVKMNAKL